MNLLHRQNLSEKENLLRDTFVVAIDIATPIFVWVIDENYVDLLRKSTLKEKVETWDIVEGMTINCCTWKVGGRFSFWKMCICSDSMVKSCCSMSHSSCCSMICFWQWTVFIAATFTDWLDGFSIQSQIT